MHEYSPHWFQFFLKLMTICSIEYAQAWWAKNMTVPAAQEWQRLWRPIGFCWCWARGSPPGRCTFQRREIPYFTEFTHNWEGAGGRGDIQVADVWRLLIWGGLYRNKYLIEFLKIKGHKCNYASLGHTDGIILLTDYTWLLAHATTLTTLEIQHIAN